MNRKERIKILEKIAQQTGTPTTTQGAAVTPRPSSSISTLFPSVSIGWDSTRVPYINKIVASLDLAAAAGTNNSYNFKTLWDQKFPAGIDSQFTSPVKDILSLLRKINLQFLNNGVPFQKALNTGDVKQRVSAILTAPEISKLEQINPSSSLGKAGVSLASIRQDLMNMLPAATTR